MKSIDAVMRSLVSESYETAARIDATKGLVAILGKKLGMEPREIESLFEEMYSRALQYRLEKLENENPAAAALLDRRPTPGVDPQPPPHS